MVFCLFTLGYSILKLFPIKNRLFIQYFNNESTAYIELYCSHVLCAPYLTEKQSAPPNTPRFVRKLHSSIYHEDEVEDDPWA